MTMTPDELDRKVRQLDNDMQAIYEMIAGVSVQQTRHLKRLEGLDAKIDHKVDALYAQLSSRLDAHDWRLNDIDQRLESLGERVDSLDNRLTAVEQRLDTIDNRLTAVEQRLDTIDNRLTTVEQRLDTLDQHLGGLDSKLDLILDRLS